MGVLLVGVFALTLSISAFSAIDESQESEKLYMMGDAQAEVPVPVVIKKGGADTKAAIHPDTQYAFENNLSAIHLLFLYSSPLHTI